MKGLALTARASKLMAPIKLTPEENMAEQTLVLSKLDLLKNHKFFANSFIMGCGYSLTSGKKDQFGRWKKFVLDGFGRKPTDRPAIYIIVQSGENGQPFEIDWTLAPNDIDGMPIVYEVSDYGELC